MANDVKWIKMMVGMFDGMSFKKIKRAKIGGESYRDKLTAVWFELMDFAGKCNHDGAFIGTNEIPFTNLSDIATMIDRDDDELELCMAFFLREGMVTIVDDVYSLANWSMYQNKDGLDKIREQTRLRVAKHRESKKLLGGVTGSVTVTQGNATDKDKDIDKEKEEDKKSNRENTRTLFERLRSEYILSESLTEKMQEWITYKIGRRESYQEVGLKALLRKVENNHLTYGEKAVCDLIDDSMANGWKGIMFDKLKEKPNKGYQKKTQADEMNDFYRMAADWSESK